MFFFVCSVITVHAIDLQPLAKMSSACYHPALYVSYEIHGVCFQSIMVSEAEQKVDKRSEADELFGWLGLF